MLISSDIYGLLEFFSFVIWFFYGLDIVALLVIKNRLKKNKNEIQPKIVTEETEEDNEFKLEVRDFFHPFCLFLNDLFTYLFQSFRLYFQ
jgi:hypothetical protein